MLIAAITTLGLFGIFLRILCPEDRFTNILISNNYEKNSFINACCISILSFWSEWMQFFDHRKIEIEKPNLNTVQSDFGSAFVSGELWFSSFTDEEITKL